MNSFPRVKKSPYSKALAGLVLLTALACNKTDNQPAATTQPNPQSNPPVTTHEIKYEIQTIDSLITGIGYINGNGDTVEVAPSDFVNNSKTFTISKTPFRGLLMVHYDNSSRTTPPSLYYIYISVDGKQVLRDYFTANTFSLGTTTFTHTVY